MLSIRPTALLLVAGCFAGCPPPAVEPDAGSGSSAIEVDLRMPAIWGLGGQARLDASGSRHPDDRALRYRWTVTAPAGCDGVLGGEGDSVATYVPACVGEHEVVVRVSTFDGESAEASGTLAVVQVSVAFGDIVAAPVGQDAQVFVTAGLGGVDPEDVTFELLVAPVAPAVGAPEVSGDGNPFRVPMLDPRGQYSLSLRAVADGRPLTETVTTVITATNGAPVVSDLRVVDGPLEAGGAVTVTATVTDPENDEVTCALSVTAGDDTDVFITQPSECTFTFDAPNRIEQWEVTFVATDGDASSSGRLTIEPANDAPMLSVVLGDPPAAVGYSCAGDTCATVDIPIELNVSDDHDGDADLNVTFAVLDRPEVDVIVKLVTPVTGDRGYTLRLSRANPGAIAGTATIEARVTETQAAVMPGYSTRELEVTVVGSPPAPTVENLSVAHTYDAVAGYLASAGVTVTPGDPEENGPALTSVTLVSCPSGDAAAGACPDSGLDVVITVDAFDVSLAFTSDALAPLVGVYGLELIVTDADGIASAPTPFEVTVTNTPPLLGLFTTAMEFTGGEWRTERLLATDPDGDPITFDTFTASCVGSQTPSSLDGVLTCGDVEVTLSGAGLFAVRGTKTFGLVGALGVYRISGDISDGFAATSITNQFMFVTKAAPTNVESLGGTRDCGHETAGASVTTTGGCVHAVTLDGTNVGPVQVEVETATADGFTMTVTPQVVEPLPAELRFTLGVSWADYVAHGTADIPYAVVAVDAFGQRSAPVNAVARLTNRPPLFGSDSELVPRTYSAVAGLGLLETESGSFYTAADRYTSNGATDPNAILGGSRACVGACEQPRMAFTVHLDASDPDGDPLQVLANVVCTDNVAPRLAGGTTAGALWYDLPADGDLSRWLWATADNCGAGYDRWYFPLAYSVNEGQRLKCTLSTNSAAVTDEVAAQVQLPSPLERSWVSFVTAPEVCAP